MRSKEQTEDLKLVFAPSKDYGKLTGWFKKAADLMIGTNAESAFVSSNSICQGEMVNLFWQKLLSNHIIIILPIIHSSGQMKLKKQQVYPVL